MGEMDKPVGFVGNGDLALKPKFAPEIGSVIAPTADTSVIFGEKFAGLRSCFLKTSKGDVESM